MEPITDPRIQMLYDQLDTLLLVLERPVVQRQLLAFILVLALAWGIARPLERWLRRFNNSLIGKDGKPIGQPLSLWRQRWLRWLRAGEFLFFPVLALMVGQMAIRSFALVGWRSGLLAQMLPIFWLVLGYRLLIGLLHAFLEAKRSYRLDRRFLTPIFIILLIAILNNALAGTFPLASMALFKLLDQPFTLGSIFRSVVIFYSFYVIAATLRQLLQSLFVNRLRVDMGIANTVTVTTYYVLMTVGLLSAVSTLGFNLSTLAIIGGGLSVGIGFGMQELIANFVSGILLLFERSLRPGDVIEIGGFKGVVEELQMRATRVRSNDNIEILIPNKNLLTSTMMTYTQTDRLVRLLVRVGASYESDPSEVREILQAVAERHGKILKKPVPEVFFAGFGASSLDFELAVWIDDPMSTRRITSDLYFMIWSDFKKRKIEIPFPQQDLHLRTVNAGLLTQLQGDGKSVEQ